MIIRLDPSFSDDDVHMIFEVIDTDHSKSIEFDELNEYFCKVNGIPSDFDEALIPQMRNRTTIWFYNYSVYTSFHTYNLDRDTYIECDNNFQRNNSQQMLSLSRKSSKEHSIVFKR